MRWSGMVAVVAVLAVALETSVAAADDGGMLMVGGLPRLMAEHPQIEMKSEFVHAWVRGDSATVECVFFFHNLGDSTTALIGFPNHGRQPDPLEAPMPFRRFESFVDGVPVWTHMVVDSSRSQPDGYAAWYLKSVHFAKGQTRCVRDVYVGGLGSSFLPGGWFSYDLYTGRSWKGPIGTADVVVTLEDFDPVTESVSADPPAASHHGRELRWHFDSIEPGMDGPSEVSAGWTPRQRIPPSDSER